MKMKKVFRFLDENKKCIGTIVGIGILTYLINKNGKTCIKGLAKDLSDLASKY